MVVSVVVGALGAGAVLGPFHARGELLGFFLVLAGTLGLLHFVRRGQWAENEKITEQKKKAAGNPDTTPEERREAQLYGNAGENMLALKVLLQQMIGLAILALLAMKTMRIFIPGLGLFKDSNLEEQLEATGYLAIVGTALSISAGVELAYMLFTPGPDEAVDPLILGVAGAVLLTVSDERIDYVRAAVLVLLMVILFAIRKAMKLGK